MRTMIQSVLVSVLLVGFTVAATQAANCRNWGKSSYFEKATAAGVRACLEAGADPNAIRKKLPPLHRAASNTRDPAVIHALVDAGAELDARADHHRYSNATPLMLAAYYRRSDIMQALVDAGADVEARTYWGSTALHIAARTNSKEKIRILLAAGANPNAENNAGLTPMNWTGRKSNQGRLLAAAGGRLGQKKKKKRDGSGGGGLGALIGVAAAVGIGTASGASTEAILAGVGAVASSQQTATGGGQPTAVQNPVGTAGSAAGGGSCEILGYPSPPGGVANLGFSWCPATVTLQVRSFALQAAGGQCAIATGSSSTPEQINARRQEINAACDRLAALGVSNCRCPAGFGGSGYSEDPSLIERDEERRAQRAKQQEEARQGCPKRAAGKARRSQAGCSKRAAQNRNK